MTFLYILSQLTSHLTYGACIQMCCEHMSSGLEVPLVSECHPWHSQAQVSGGRSSAFLQSPKAESPLIPRWTAVIIQVSDLCFWTFQTPPTGVPILPHYLSLDIALNITVMANSDSILDCQRDQAICCALGLQKLSI